MKKAKSPPRVRLAPAAMLWLFGFSDPAGKIAVIPATGPRAARPIPEGFHVTEPRVAAHPRLRRRRQPGADARPGPRPLRPGLHHQPDTDAPVRRARLRRVRPKVA